LERIHRYIYIHLSRLNNFSMCILLLLFLSLFGNGAICLWTFSVVLSFSESRGLELAVEAEAELDGVGVAGEVDGYETWLSTFFLDLSVWTTLYWLIWAPKIWLEFFGLASGWLGKIPLGLSLRELASWLIWTSSLEIACVWLFSICPVFLHEGIVGLQKGLLKLLKFTEFSFGGLVLKRGGGCLIGREVLLMVLVMTIIGKVRSHGIILASGEVLVTSPSRIVRLWLGVILWPCIGRIQMFWWCLVSLEHWALFKKMIWCLVVSATRIVNLWRVDLISYGWFFCLQCFNSPHEHDNLCFYNNRWFYS